MDDGTHVMKKIGVINKICEGMIVGMDGYMESHATLEQRCGKPVESGTPFSSQHIQRHI
jgi:hypothetical protein